MNTIRFALLSCVLVAVPAAAQQSSDRMFETARQVALSLLGLSPEGADTVARRQVAFSSPDRFKELTRLDLLIGEELARERPDRALLAQLTEAVAKEEASLARTQRQHTIATAFQLSDRDRRAFGQVIARNHRAELANEKPVLTPLP